MRWSSIWNIVSIICIMKIRGCIICCYRCMQNRFYLQQLCLYFYVCFSLIIFQQILGLDWRGRFNLFSMSNHLSFLQMEKAQPEEISNENAQPQDVSAFFFTEVSTFLLIFSELELFSWCTWYMDSLWSLK